MMPMQQLKTGETETHGMRRLFGTKTGSGIRRRPLTGQEVLNDERPPWAAFFILEMVTAVCLAL
jgi:hypothetical protein